MSTRGGRGGGGRWGGGDFSRGGGRGSGRGGDFSRGGGRGSGRGGDFSRDGGRGSGRGGDFSRDGGRGSGRGGGRGDTPPPRREPPISGVQSARPPALHVASSSLASSSADPSASLSSGVERLRIAEVEKEPLAITATVTATATAVKAAPPPSSSKEIKPPLRPGYGTLGTKCMVRANHFLVEVANRDLNHYDVAITPEVTSRAACREIISQLVTFYKDSHLGRFTPVYDGRKSLYTAGPLPFTSKQFKVKLTDRNREKEYNVTIKHAGRADLHHLQQFLHGRQFDAPRETIQVLDIVLRELPTQKYVPISRSFFSTTFGARRDIGLGFECWRGFYQSLRPTQMGLSLNIDISATSFYKPVSVVDFAVEYLRLKDSSSPLTEKQRVILEKALRGIRIEVTHQKNCRRRYKITGITKEPLHQLTFPVKDTGTTMRVVQYFWDEYQINLGHVTWPCLKAGSDAKLIYLPPEVCKIVEGQRYTKKLDRDQVKEILRVTCQRPQVRERSIMEMVKQNNYAGDKYANEFGIRVTNTMALVEARVLPPPVLKYGDSGKEKTCSPMLGAWNMLNKRMVNGGRIQNWACISFSQNVHPNAVYNFCERLFGVCGSIGMTINPRPVLNIMPARLDNIEGALRQVHSQATSAMKGGALQLLLIVLPGTTEFYGTIKRVCETELGIVSQCFLQKHIQDCSHQTMVNLALKINVKVGGCNTVLADAISKRIPLVGDLPTIIFGADVTHPAPGEDSSASIAAVVASMDWPQVTKYRGLVSAQTHRVEIIQDLYVKPDPQKGTVVGGMIRELFIAFKNSTGQKPHRIIFYRDGVSEGQFSDVLLYEMDAIRKACLSLEKDYMPPVTFVVVQKRHHTRLFPEYHGQNTDKSGNILPGTVVDKKITHPTEFDFFLCSHAGIQGTSRPTHYHVLYDENNFTADGLQSLTNNLCYTFARCTRSVSVVPPAYYAHLAAFRARCYVEGDSDRGSGSGGGKTRVKGTEVKSLPQIKDNVKDVMFYC